MPSTGFYLFLLENDITTVCKFMVSMPSTGFYLFLPGESGPIIKQYSGVNALNGLLLISSNYNYNLSSTSKIVSMPSTGFYLFLPLLNFWKTAIHNVSMPSTGFYLFLHNLKKCSTKTQHIKCQCPQRASTYFFSTLPEPLILLSSGEVFCK